MKDPFSKYFLFTFLFSLVIATAAFILSQLFSDLIVSSFYFILIYFFLLTVGFHYGLMLSAKGRPQKFAQYFLGGTAVKLMLHLVVIIGYSLTHRSEYKTFIFSFFVLYILFTVYETRFAMKLNRASSKISS